MNKIIISLLVLVVVVFGIVSLLLKPNTITTAAGPVFDIPRNWEFLEEKDGMVRMLTHEADYRIVAGVEVKNKGSKWNDNYELLEKTNHSTIYQIACSGGLCLVIDLNGTYYSGYWWSVESDQPVPEGTDGPWAPDTNYDREDIMKIMRTFRLE